MSVGFQCKRSWVQIPATAMKLFQKLQTSLFNWGYKWTWMLTLSLSSLVPGLQWKSSWAAVEKLWAAAEKLWAAVEKLSEQRLESGFYHGEWRQRQRKCKICGGRWTIRWKWRRFDIFINISTFMSVHPYCSVQSKKDHHNFCSRITKCQ